MLQLHSPFHCLASVHLGHLTPGPSWPSVPSQERSRLVALKPVRLPTKREPSLPTLSSVYAHPLVLNVLSHPCSTFSLRQPYLLHTDASVAVPTASAQAQFK